MDPPLEDVVEVAHANSVPVIVDAAAELPPTENLSRLIKTGADLVVFSGGKAIRGPQTTGIMSNPVRDTRCRVNGVFDLGPNYLML
jgi:L-seryl-tRNA(Ser) seleniumtransferase